MSSHDSFWTKRVQAADRLTRTSPIRRVIHWWSMHLRVLRDRGVNGFLTRRHEGIAHDQRPVLFTPEGNMARRMAWRRQPAPSGHVWHRSIIRQGTKVLAHIDWPTRKHGGGQRHESATDGRVRWWVSFATIQVRVLERTCVHRHIPFPREIFQSAYVIEVPVREHDCRRP